MSGSRLARTTSLADFASTLSPERLALIDGLFQVFGQRSPLCGSKASADVTLGASELRELLGEMHAHCSAQEVEELLAKLDRDGDGRISRDEFVAGLKWVQRAMELTRSDARCHADHEGLASGVANASTMGDYNRSNKLSRDTPTKRSVADFARQLGTEEVARARDLFHMVDADGNGEVSREELRSIMLDLGVSSDENQFEEMWQRLGGDCTGDAAGGLKFEDFLRGMKTLQAGLQLVESRQPEKKEKPPLAQQHEILARYVRDVVSDALKLAEKSCDAGHPGVAVRLLELIDYDVVKSLEPLVGSLTDEGTDELARDVAAKIHQIRKQ